MSQIRPQSALRPTAEELMELQLDITEPPFPVEIKTARGPGGHVIWINVGPVCVLRICRVGKIDLEIAHDARV